MEVRKSAIDEISRLRLHQSSVESCKNWAYGSVAVFVSLFFTSIPASYGQFKSAAQIFSLFTLFCSATYIYFSGKPRTTLNKKQMKLLGLSEDDVTHQQAVVPTVPGSRPSTAPSTASASSSNMLSPAVTPKTPSVTQMRVTPSPLTHRRDYTTSSAYRTPSSSQQQQHDLKDYDILNATQIAASYRRGVLPGDTQNCHTQSNNRASNTTPSSSGTGPGAQGQGGLGTGSGGGGGIGGGGSYRGYGASPGVTYPPGPGSNGGLKATSSAYDTPYSQERSPKVFKTYNVSPMIDATSPVYLPSGALGTKGSSGQKGGIGGPKLVSLNALTSLGLDDISDTWIDNLKKLLGKYLQRTFVSLDGIVETLLSDMKGRGLAEHINTARDLLTFKIEKGSFGPGSAVTRVEFLTTMLSNINPKLVKDFLAIEFLFHPVKMPLNLGMGGPRSASTGPLGMLAPASSSFECVQGTYKRARELNSSHDEFLRIAWPSTPASGRSPYSDHTLGGEVQVSDADFVISLFMHFCDVKGSGAGQRYSSAHYVTAVQDIPELSSAHTSTQGPGSLIGILRLDSLSSHSPGTGAGTGAGAGHGVKYPGMGGGSVVKPHFDVFCTDSRLTEILSIESGRQNCFMSIIVFLLKSLKAATDGQVSQYRGGGGKYVAPVIEEACLEVFQTRDIDSLIEYLGFDCSDTDAYAPRNIPQKR